MVASELSWLLPKTLLSFHSKPSQSLLSSSSSLTFKINTTLLLVSSSSTSMTSRSSGTRVGHGSCRASVCFALSETRNVEELEEDDEEEGEEDSVPDDNGGGNSTVILSSCLVGLITGISVVVFNYGVHEIRDLFWDGIPYRGASWLREEPIQEIWKRVILVPTSGGLIVATINVFRSALEDNADEKNGGRSDRNQLFDGLRAFSRPFLKTLAACVTLGTGNSLGPEGPSVEIGSSIGKGVSSLIDKRSDRKLSLVAAGSAAGIASGFNAAVAGCFFAVESVLWPSPSDPSSLALTNTTSMVILSAVIGSVVSEIGLGSNPAFKVPEYDFRSPTELPLYLLLGVLCGVVSLALSKLTSYMMASVENFHDATGIPKPLFPVLGGLSVGVIALAYPEILYWGFQNVDILLESRPFVKGLSADLLVQLVAVKIFTTSLCRASGLVGGYYAPSLFIGGATGMAYGKIIGFAVSQPNPLMDISFLEVASPQAYGLVGMAATLAGVCQVPLTAVLLLFELTRDYRILLPLLGAVGLSSWVTSGQSKRRDSQGKNKQKEEKTSETQQPDNTLPSNSNGSPLTIAQSEKESNNNSTSDLCEIESSLCIGESDTEAEYLEKKIIVLEAMRTRYVTVTMNTLLTEALTQMLKEKQPCAMIIDNENNLIGFLTLRGIQEFGKFSKTSSGRSKEILVSEMCSLDGETCRVPWAATPGMDLISVQIMMTRRGINQVPVVAEQFENHRGNLVGLLDQECINLTRRALAARESLGEN